jgi:hypothetical protein
MKIKRRARYTWAAAAVAAAALAAAGAGLAGSAKAETFHTSYMTKSFTPWSSTTSQGAQYWTVGKGTTVSMVCWNTGSYVDGTGKWFWIKSSAYPYTQGYVPGNDVGNQWLSSPHC